MNSVSGITSTLTLTLILTTGCGGGLSGTNASGESSANSAEDINVQLSAEDLRLRATLQRAVLTTAVDARRYRPSAPEQTEFDPTVPIIYLVGKLKHIPTHSRIETRWYRDADPEPLLVSDVRGSESYQFIASLSAEDKRFIPGTYIVRIFVDHKEVGARPFRITGTDPLDQGAKIARIAVSPKVDRNMNPKAPAKRFKRGTHRLYASFVARHVIPGSVATVRWLRNGNLFHEEDMEIDGERRYGAQITANGGLPSGAYEVEVQIDATPMGNTFFKIGNGNGDGGPAIDTVRLGHQLNANNMPKKALKEFRRDTSVIQCGLRFLDVPQDSVIEIQWVQIEEDGESVCYVNRSSLAAGGSGTMGAAWEPTYELTPGQYKAVVLVNDEVLAEQDFVIR